MSVFVDTSAIIAYLDAGDRAHRRVRVAFDAALDRDRLITSNYVLVETMALVDRRFGASATRRVGTDLVHAFEIEWVDWTIHAAAMSAFLAARPSRVSLVDAVSFEIMRRRGVGTALTVDRDFTTHGFTVRP